MELIETFIVVTLHVHRTNIFYFLFFIFSQGCDIDIKFYTARGLESGSKIGF